MADTSRKLKGRAPVLRALGSAAPWFVVVALVLLLFAPLAIGARVLDARSLRSDVQEPARLDVQVIALTAASQTAAIRAYAVVPDEDRRSFALDYRRAHAAQRLALEELTTRLPRLSPQTQADVVALRAALRSWHATHDALLAGRETSLAFLERLRAQQDLANRVLARSQAALESLAVETEATHERIEGLTRLHVALTAALAALALLAIGAALWLGARGRRLEKALADQALAEHLAAARADVLSWVSHDLKNPLAAIRMACTNLRRSLEKSPERAPRVVDSIDRSALRMSRLIGDLLDSARLDAGRALVLNTRAVKLDALITRTCDEAAQQPGVDVKVRYTLPADLPDVHGDKLHLEQALLNLVQNAIRASPSEGVIEVSAEREREHVKVAVRDEGPGIPDDVIPRLFQPFRAAKRGEGSGLGLSIVKGVVEAHGGDVWLQSKAGEGTTFFFTVPIAEQRRDETAPARR